MRRALVPLALLLAGCPKPAQRPSDEVARPHAESDEAAGPRDGGVGYLAAEPADGGAGEFEAPEPLSPTVRILVKSSPPKARVRWGKKVLGMTPVRFERPRDSGPIDLVVTRPGYLPVHTRAYTFRNDALSVKLTPLEEKLSIYGARKELPEEPDGGAPTDGGVAPSPSSSPSPETAPAPQPQPETVPIGPIGPVQ